MYNLYSETLLKIREKRKYDLYNKIIIIIIEIVTFAIDTTRRWWFIINYI